MQVCATEIMWLLAWRGFLFDALLEYTVSYQVENIDDLWVGSSCKE